MNRLGAYRVDRRKKNGIYLETLKVMSNLSIQRGVNDLFFPGGTRSRSGELETDVKMGLLGTALEAQHTLCQHQSDKKVFVVPMVICYNFVLEAPFLIEQHLQSTGKEHYLRLKDKGAQHPLLVALCLALFVHHQRHHPQRGQTLGRAGQFWTPAGAGLRPPGQRDRHPRLFYGARPGHGRPPTRGRITKIIAERVVERYHKENVVLPSHLVAYAVFEVLMHGDLKLDLFGLLRLPPEDYLFTFQGHRRSGGANAKPPCLSGNNRSVSIQPKYTCRPPRWSGRASTN